MSEEERGLPFLNGTKSECGVSQFACRRVGSSEGFFSGLAATFLGLVRARLDEERHPICRSSRVDQKYSIQLVLSTGSDASRTTRSHRNGWFRRAEAALQTGNACCCAVHDALIVALLGRFVRSSPRPGR